MEIKAPKDQGAPAKLFRKAQRNEKLSLITLITAKPLISRTSGLLADIGS